MARGKKSVPVEIPSDPTGAFLLANGFAEFVLMHTNEIVSAIDARVEMCGLHCCDRYIPYTAWPHRCAFFFSLAEIYVHDWIHLHAW
jgi:hypothetical protein